MYAFYLKVYVERGDGWVALAGWKLCYGGLLGENYNTLQYWCCIKKCVLFCFLRLLITAHGMKFTAQLYVFKDQLENMIKVTELTALYWSNDNNSLSLSLCFVFKSFFSLAYLSEFLFDVLSVAVFVIRDRFAKKSWHMLKSLSLCNKVLSILSLSLSLTHTHTYTHTHTDLFHQFTQPSQKRKKVCFVA